MQGAVLGGKYQSLPAPADTTPDLQRINGAIQRAISDLRETNERLSSFIGRIYGTSDGEGKNASVPQPAGVMGSLDRQMSELDDIAARYRNMVDRLGGLA